MKNLSLKNRNKGTLFPAILPPEFGSSQWSWLLLLGLFLCIPFAFGMSGLQSKVAKQSTVSEAAPQEAIQVALAAPDLLDKAKRKVQSHTRSMRAQTQNWQTVKVRKGDNLTLIFFRLGLDSQQLHQIMSNGGPARALSKLHPGDELRIRIAPKGKLQELVYHLSATESVRARRSGNGFGVTSVHRVPEKRIAQATAKIKYSLFLAAKKAGLSHHMTMELSQLFGWDIDFALDIRKGDEFILLYEELYLDGKKIGEGEIIAAEFVNKGRVYQAVHYATPGSSNSYYTPKGKSMRKAFLRTPVAFSRISSRFNLKRKHPVLNRIRAHKGVDYAAPMGTPVKATGNGKIKFRGTKGGYGRTVILDHGGRYQTLYAHLSRYARGKSRGSRVKQGDIIGYVGRTGLATGPHLHYEFLVNGVHRNPLTVRLPSASPIDKRHREDFKHHAGNLIARLNLAKKTRVAQLDSGQ